MIDSPSVANETVMTSPSGRSLRGSHQLAAFSVCERLAELRYVHGWVPKVEKEDTLRGTLVHLALAYYAASRMPAASRPEWYYQRSMMTALEQRGRGCPDGIAKAVEVMRAFDVEYGDTLPRWEPVAIEAEYIVPLREIDPMDGEIAQLKQAWAAQYDAEERRKLDAQLARLEMLKKYDDEAVSCRPDVIVHIDTMQGPELWVVDYKTHNPAYGRSSALRTWYQDAEYLLHWQVLVNLVIARSPSAQARLGHRFVKGFVIQRMTRKPDSRGRYHFERHILTIPKLAYTRAPRRMREAVVEEHAVREKMANGIASRQNFWACHGRYGPCDYRPLCAADNLKDACDSLVSNYRQGEATATATDEEE